MTARLDSIPTPHVAPARPASAGAQGDPAEAPLFDLDLSRIIFAIRRNIWWIGAIIACALALGLVATLLMQPRYIATSRVLIEQQADQIIENNDVTPAVAYQDADRFLQTQVDVIRSRALAAKVVDDGKFWTEPAFFDAVGTPMPTEADLDYRYQGKDALQRLRRDTAIDAVVRNLSVSLPDASRLVAISFSGSDPNYAAKLANLFAESYVSANLARKFDSSSYAREYLAQQLDQARIRLETSERDLNQYSRAAGLVRVQGQGQNADKEATLSVTNDTLVQVNGAASQATAERIAAEDRWNSVRNSPVMTVPQVLENPAIQALIRQRSEVESQLAQESSRHLAGHPTAAALQAQVDRLSAQIMAVGNAIKSSVRIEFQAAQAKEATLQRQVVDLRILALGEQDRGVQYNILKRVAETNRSLYDTLLARYNELNATAGATSNNVSLVDRAETPRFPASPKLVLNLGLALLAGILCAGIFVFVREHFDDAIRAPDDVEHKLGVPLLGLVPQEASDDIRLEMRDPKSALSEAYNSLIANLRYAGADGFPKILTITSSRAEEGKSTTSVAIAEQLAKLGRKTLLIDGDLRRPTVHKILDLPSAHGLTALLTGEIGLDRAILGTDVPNLYAITALPTPVNPSLLLGSTRLEALMQHCRGQFDHVIIDSPPMLGLSDATSLSVASDATLLVIDASKGHRGTIKSTLRRLTLVHAPVVGALLTKFDPRRAGGNAAYYGYDYYEYGRPADSGA